MATLTASNLDQEHAMRHLLDQGYVLIEGVLTGKELEAVRQSVAEIMERERQAPFDPGDGPESADDREMDAYLRQSYDVSDAERARVMRRVRHTRGLNLDTPWPVPPQQMNKSFLHLPTLFDHDRSQRIWNVPAKLPQAGRIIEDPTVLTMARAVLGEDCVLSDLSATSIGPHTDGGSWHIDAPLTQLPEPLPDFPLTVQNAWMLDDFTEDNGATRLVPGSHHTRKKPVWGTDAIDGEIILTAPAGSMGLWLSQTWHRSGANFTDRPRRALLGYYCRSWIKPFSDYAATTPHDVGRSFSPTVRYLLGWSASGPRRG